MKKKILCIQGGGVNGIFAAQLLAKIEQDLEEKGHHARAGRYFDLISGTSTGGLIALALALEIPAKRIVEIYLEKSSKIFPKERKNFFTKAVRYLAKNAWYNPDPLIDELKNVFDQKKVGDAITRLLIPTYQVTAGQVRVFKTAHHQNFRTDYKIEAWDVAAATSAAPMFFPPHQMEFDNSKYIDGGVWANNPSLIAAIEGINFLEWPRNSLEILSIGGVQDLLPSKHWNRAQHLPGALLKAQVDGTIAATKNLLGHVNRNDKKHGYFENFFQSQPPGQFELDNAKSVGDVAGFANTIHTHRGEDLLERFFANTVPAFSPFPLE